MSEEDNESTADKIQGGVESILTDMLTMVGEIRLKAHLGSMDAKTKWEELEPKVKEFEARMGDESEKATEELHSMGHDLRGKLKDLRARFEDKKED